jgi:hypothetical protein
MMARAPKIKAHAAGEMHGEADFDSGWHRQQHVNSK